MRVIIEALPHRTPDDVLAAYHVLAAMARLHLGVTCRAALLGENGVDETALDG